MKFSKLFLIAAVVAALSACSKNNDKGNAGPDGNPHDNAPDAYIFFSVRIPESSAQAYSLHQRAANDPDVTAENTITSLYIFTYDAVTPFKPAVARFSISDGTLVPKQGSTSEWITDSPVKVKKTDKYIFAGLNLPQSVTDIIYDRGFESFNYEEQAQTVSALTDGTNGFVMFNDPYPSVTASSVFFDTQEQAQAAPFPINVKRVVAKTAVFKSPDFIVRGGGTITGLSYGWRNINNKFYLVQKIDGGLIKDYNWDKYAASDFTGGTDEFPVNENGATPSVFSYATENAFQYSQDNAKVDQATFISISAIFTPAKIIQVKKSVSVPSSAADFETIDNPSAQGTTFYTVRTDDGRVNCFTDAQTATAYASLAIAKAAGMPPLAGPYAVENNTYTNGKCYYHIFVNAKATAPQAPYNIYRNQYYKVTLNSIQALGYPSDHFDDGKLITENAWIAADIELIPWEVIESSEDL